MSLIKRKKTFKMISDTMNDVWEDAGEIGKASIDAFIIMYKGDQDTKLSKPRQVFK